MSLPIMERLKEETRDLHSQAEGQPLEQDLAKGRIAREAFVDYLAQRYRIHEAFDEALRGALGKHSAFAAVARDYHYHAPRLAADLRFFGTEPDTVEPSEDTRALIAEIQRLAREEPVSLLGVQYVFEGSTNGARFIARAIRGVFRLEGTDGTRYLDPYGEEQRARWGAFKQAMNEQTFTPAEQDGIVEAGKKVFAGIIAIDGDIAARHGIVARP